MMAALTKNCLVFTVCLLHLVQLSLAQFVFDFQLHAVTTNGDCSSVLELFYPECETYLNRFCLRERDHSRSTDDSDCPLGSSGKFGPGGNLPISRQILSSQSWPGAFMMLIKAYDEDSVSGDDFLDNIFIDMALSESNESDYFTAVREFTGDMNKVSVNMTFRVRMCPENFYGANCDTFCLAQDDDVNGHYICNGDGSIQCLPGFENTTNNCRDVVNPCEPTPCANNGNCTSMGPFNYTCQCAPGYTGSACEDVIDGCLEITCPNNSVCVNGSLCVCLPGYELTGGVCAPTPSTDKPTGSTDSQTGSASVIIGSVVGGVVVLILLVLIIVVIIVVVIANRRRTDQLPQKLQEDSSSNMSPEPNKDTLKLEMTTKTPLKNDSSMMDNPVYDQVSPDHTPQAQQQESTMSESAIDASVSIASNPVYSATDSAPSYARPNRPTVRHVQNPVYGDPSDRSTNENTYSSADQMPTQSHEDDSDQPEYSYAIVDAPVGRNTNKVTTEASGSDGEALLKHEYAVVDKSKKTHHVVESSPDDFVGHQPYDQLKHGHGTASSQNQAQRTVRLAENEDLGYSALS